MVGELIDTLKFLVDGLSQCKGIGSGSKLLQFCELERIGLRTSGHTVKRCLGLVIAAFELGTEARLADQFHRRQKQVLEGSQLVSVKIIDRLLDHKRIVAQVAEDFTHVSPVFLLDMSIVVFL